MTNLTSQEIVKHLVETTGDTNWYVNTKVIGTPVAHRNFPPLAVQRHVTEAVKRMKHKFIHAIYHPDNTKLGNLMQHSETGMFYVAGGSSGHPVKSTTFHKTAQEAHDAAVAKASASYGVKRTNEALSASMGADEYIHDFVHSKNPKFEGKSKKKRVQMALAAYYAAKRGMKEEVEQIDEALDHEVNKYAHHILTAHDHYDPDIGNGHRHEAHRILKHIEKHYGPVGVRWAEARAAEHIENHEAVRRKRELDDLKDNYRKQRNLVKVKEEVEQIEENNEHHTHAAHFEDPETGEWSGMQLFSAKNDAEAVEKAHELAKEHGKLASVERHVPIKENVIETDADLELVLNEARSKEEKQEKARQVAMNIIRSGKGSTALRQRLATLHGINIDAIEGKSVKQASKQPNNQAKSVDDAKEVSTAESPAQKLRKINAARQHAAMYGRAHGNRVSGGAGPSHSSASDIVNRTAIEAQQKKK